MTAARCEGCGRAYWLLGVGQDAARAQLECDDCGCPVYALADGDFVDLVELIESCVDCGARGAECTFHAGFAAGWDACAAMVAAAVEEHRAAELVGDGL